jgi:molybdopterin synthase sulfur carrier subunit
MAHMATLRLFAAAREAAGRGSDTFDAGTVGELLEAASSKYGPNFVRVLASCRVWCNGDETDPTRAITASDEIAVLPPVSGGI